MRSPQVFFLPSVLAGHVRVGLLFIVVLVATLALPGCATNEPHLSGFGLGHNRVVRVGDLVTLRSPATDRGDRKWRVSSFDSLYLSVEEGPVRVVNDAGDVEVVTSARANYPGTTTIEIVEVLAAGGATPRVITYTVRIVE